METIMRALAEKLCAEREKEPPVKPNHIALLKAVFCPSEEPDASLNDSAELAEAVTKALSVLSSIKRYCVEERYLHGKSLEQLADEFRASLDMEDFADRMTVGVYRSVKCEFMNRVDSIFGQMEDNSFRELEYKDGAHPEGFPKNDTYYEPNADKTVLDILRDTLKNFDGCRFSRKELFELRYMRGRTNEELAQWLSDNMEGYVDEICVSALRRLRHPSVCRGLKKLLGYEQIPQNSFRIKDKCRSCIYGLLRGYGEQTECSACRTSEVKEWLVKTVSELPTEERRVIGELYDTNYGSYTFTTRKEIAVKLGIVSKERVEELEKSARHTIGMKAMSKRFRTKSE